MNKNSICVSTTLVCVYVKARGHHWVCSSFPFQLLLSFFLCKCMHVWRPKDSMEELLLSYHVDSGDQIQVIRLGGKRLYPLSQLTGPPSCLRQVHWTWNLSFKLDWLVSEHLTSAFLYPLTLSTKVTDLCSRQALTWDVDGNTGPHSCMTSTLSVELSPQPYIAFETISSYTSRLFLLHSCCD